MISDSLAMCWTDGTMTSGPKHNVWVSSQHVQQGLSVSMGQHLTYVFGTGSDLAEPRISSVSEIKCVNQGRMPCG